MWTETFDEVGDWYIRYHENRKAGMLWTSLTAWNKIDKQEVELDSSRTVKTCQEEIKSWSNPLAPYF
jgi:hypothetical protein